MWLYIHLALQFVALISILVAIYYADKTFKLSDKIIKDLSQLVDDQFEALSRSRDAVRMYKEENERCWKALAVMEANYNEVVGMLEKEWKKAPQK